MPPAPDGNPSVPAEPLEELEPLAPDEEEELGGAEELLLGLVG